MMNDRDYSNEYLTLYLNCKDFNCLPYEGGFLDQPAKIAQAFEIIRNIMRQYEKNQKGGEM